MFCTELFEKLKGFCELKDIEHVIKDPCFSINDELLDAEKCWSIYE